MTTAAPTLKWIALRTLLWLPICLSIWYFSAHYHTAIAGLLAHLMIDWYQPIIVTSLEQSGTSLEFVTTLKVQSDTGRIGLLVPEVNPLLYTYGLAFFVALMLAANSEWWKILLGAVILLPFQSWGIALDLLVQVGIKISPDVARQAGILGWHREAIALGYQIGNLIFPTLIPVILWVSFNRSLIEGLLRK